MELRLVRKNAMQVGSLRAGAIFAAVLASWLVSMPALAEQVSVEASARAAGLVVETANANVNGVTTYYRDIGVRGEPAILLHGFPETGDAFASAVALLGKRYRLTCRICAAPVCHSAPLRVTRRGRSPPMSRS
jgi:hypothetical protein